MMLDKDILPKNEEEDAEQRVRLGQSDLAVTGWGTTAVRLDSGEEAVHVKVVGRFNKTNEEGAAVLLISPDNAKAFAKGLARSADVASMEQKRRERKTR